MPFFTVIFSAVFFLHLRSVLLLNLLSYAQHKPMCLCIFGSLINYLFTMGECLKGRVAFFPFFSRFLAMHYLSINRQSAARFQRIERAQIMLNLAFDKKMLKTL
ncbi:hypothetical protein FG142_10010 [Vibrio cholerae]|nr:hypothetical protein [Vibrio cholerae]